MNQNATTQSDDEVDLFALLQIIWDGKWSIVICTVIALTGAGLFIFNSKSVYEVSLPIYGPDLETMTQFEQINRFYNLGKPIISNDRIIGYEDSIIDRITAEKFETLFVEEFNDYEEVNESIKTYSSAYAIFKGTERERSEFIGSRAKNFALDKIATQSNDQHYMLNFFSPERDQATLIAEFIINNVSANTNSTVLQYLNIAADAAKAKSVSRIFQFENEMASRVKVLLIRHNQKIHFLTEQASIARKLGMKETVQHVGALTMDDKSSMAVFAQAPYYLRGYKVIEIELQQLQAKDKKEIFFADPIYVELLEKLENEKSNSIHKEFDAALEKAPLKKSDKLFQYNLTQIQIKKITKRNLILALSVIFGSVLGVVLVLFRHGYKQHNSDNSL